jgi:zinc transporter ZupT
MASELVVLALAAAGTALATGLGAIPVFVLGERATGLRPLLWGVAAGLMGVASVVGLLVPALDAGSTAAVAGGLVAGVLFLHRAARSREQNVNCGWVGKRGEPTPISHRSPRPRRRAVSWSPWRGVSRRSIAQALRVVRNIHLRSPTRGS